MDGNHKLINWHFVIHGCIDGFSRVIVFLKCSTNNRGSTVLDNFLGCIDQFRCPLRIRTDHGTENIETARWMLNRYGVAHKPVITGQSVHNQRIERLWVDVYNNVLEHIRNVFFFLEENDLLDRDDEIDLLALQFVFLPRINAALQAFVSSWNNHPLRTERNQTPLQKWIDGFYAVFREDSNTVQDLLDVTHVEMNAYGIDNDGPMPQLQTRNDVQVPDLSINLSDQELAHLLDTVNPMENDNNFGVTVYENCRQAIGDLIERRDA